MSFPDPSESMGDLLGHESFSELAMSSIDGAGFDTSDRSASPTSANMRGPDEWEMENGDEWGSAPNGDTTSHHEAMTSATNPGPDELVPDGVIGEEYLSLMRAKAEARSEASTPPRDPYHGRCMEPRLSRDPPRESFNLMVVGEAGLGKTTLLESFFKSFKDDDATFALFERKEAQQVIETRRQIEEAAARKNVCERDVRVFAEKALYVEANERQEEIKALAREMVSLNERLKELCAADEKRRTALQELREQARLLRMDMKRAADEQDFQLAAEKQKEAEAVQRECDKLQAELKQMRRREASKDKKGDAAQDEEGEEGGAARSRSAINGATVRVTPFDPFNISVGKHELQVTLIDTPGYGEFVNTEESFEVIGRYVEEQFESHLARESDPKNREPERMAYDDGMIHCCLYFIAPHRLKHIDLAFMRRLHRYVNIVPIIAKSDTMTTKEKEEFKLQVREALISSGVDLFPFDMDVVRQMEKLDRQEYKPPWAVIGSTDAYLEAGHTVYQRKYPWGNALSSEPNHSDLPALRNLVMWSGQWQELKLSTRAKYETWRAERSLLADASTSLGNACHAAAMRTAALGRAVAAKFRLGCRLLRLPPRPTAAVLLLLLIAAAGAAVAAGVRARMQAELSASRKLELLREELTRLSADKAKLARTHEERHAALAIQLGESKAVADEAITARKQLQRELAATRADAAKEAREAKTARDDLARDITAARKAQARAETIADAATIRANAATARSKEKCDAKTAPGGEEGELPPPSASRQCSEGACNATADGDGSWNLPDWAFGAPERAWEATEGFARDVGPKARKAYSTIEAASEKLGPAISSTAAKASQAARGGMHALRKSAGAAAKQWIQDVKSAVVQPVG